MKASRSLISETTLSFDSKIFKVFTSWRQKARYIIYNTVQYKIMLLNSECIIFVNPNIKIKHKYKAKSKLSLNISDVQTFQFPRDPRCATLWPWFFHSRLESCMSVNPLLVGGFNPFGKYLSNWKSSPNRGENNKYLKPPPSTAFNNKTCGTLNRPSAFSPQKGGSQHFLKVQSPNMLEEFRPLATN